MSSSPTDFAPAGEFLPALLDLLPTGVLGFAPLRDAAGHITDLAIEYLNPAARRLLHLPARPDTYLAHFPDARTNGRLDFLRRTYESGAPDSREIDLPAGPGHRQYFRVSAHRVGDKLLATLTDATDEAALRASEAREQAARAEAELQRAQLRNVFEQAPAMICIFDGPEHRFQFVNGPYQALVGNRPLLGLPIAEAMPELAGQPIFDLLDNVYRTGEPFYATEMLVQLDHDNDSPSELEKRYYNFTYQARRDLRGQVDGILVFAYEVTAQVQARQQVEQLNKDLEGRVAERTQETQQALHEAHKQREQLREQQGLLQQILGQVPAAVATLAGAEHRFTFINTQYQHMVTGRARLGQTVAEVLPEVVAQGFIALLDGVYTTGEPYVGTEVSLELINPATGLPEHQYVDFVYQPLTDAQQQTQGILVFAVNTTDKVLARQQVQALNEELATINAELQATNAELNKSNARLSRTNSDLDTFVYSASHDLKAPITNIEGLLLALREQLPPAARQVELVPRLLELMEGSITRFQQTLSHLTDVSRLQQYHLDQPTEAVNLPELVEAVRLDILPELTAAQATLHLELHACPTVNFPIKNLRSILYNLLSNAIKYRAPSRPPAVVLRCHNPANARTVVLEVVDNGLGLSEAQQGELFRLFRRLHHHVPGSGVGLYMVKKMVENANGTLQVRSELGVGTTFTVVLPAPAA